MTQAVKVLRHTGHQVSRGETPQKNKILTLNSFVHVPAHPGHYIGTGDFHHNHHEVTQAQPGKLNRHHYDKQGDQRLGVLRRYYIVNQFLGKHGNNDAHYGSKARQDKPKNKSSPLSFHVIPNPLYLRHSKPYL
jgi:hypothetical protein